MEKVPNDNQIYLEKNVELRQLMETLSIEVQNAPPGKLVLTIYPQFGVNNSFIGRDHAQLHEEHLR